MFFGPQRDDLDREILFTLQENARLSTSHIAKNLNVARSTVHERITRLEREGIIQGYTAVVKKDPGERQVQAILYLELERSNLNQIICKLHGYPEIRSCNAITGEFDLFCTIEAPLLEDLDALLDEISALPHVLRLKSNVILANKFERDHIDNSQNVRPYLKAVGS